MEYTERVGNSKITENKWAIDNVLNFSSFSSCIGIVGFARNGNGRLFGIHLVQADSDFFSNSDAQTVIQLVNDRCGSSNVKIFGCMEFWEANPAYQALLAGLPSATFVDQPSGDGEYGVSLSSQNAIVIKKGSVPRPEPKGSCCVIM